MAAAGDYVVGGMQTVGTKGGPSGTYVFGPLANGETRQIVVSAARSGANSQCGPNTVEIVNNENDPIQSNNQAEVPTNCAVEVDKSSVGNVRVDGAGTYTATYDITVSGFGNYAEVIDRPTLPAGAVMNEVSVIFVNEAGQQRAKRVLASRPDGSYKLDENSAQRTLSGSGSGVHVYKVEMKFTIDPAQWHEAYGDVQNGDCKTRGGIGNAVTVGQSTDEVCDDVPPPSLPDPTLKIIKMGPDGNPLPLEGVRFAVNRPDGSHVTDLEIDGAYLTATLEYDEEYVLVELQSPTGYSLLGKEIPFRILMENGRAVVQVEGAPIEISVLPATSESPFEPVVEVVNVYKGELPLTGGSGWYRLGLIGLLLAGAAVLAATRSAQKN
ncbi:hypothetical protein CSTAT_11875 [Corynebacterium stationis]|nr:hypothetical protein CSTAT_11875 [Corynebacterium stationis]